jgi:hypothetical protein
VPHECSVVKAREACLTCTGYGQGGVAIAENISASVRPAAGHPPPQLLAGAMVNNGALQLLYDVTPLLPHSHGFHSTDV